MAQQGADGASSGSTTKPNGMKTATDDCCCSCCCCSCCKESDNPIPEHLRDGDIFSNRSCTDCPMLLLYLVFLGGWVVIIAVALSLGKPSRILLPEAFDGQLCGEEPLADRPNFFAPLPSRPSYGFCVKTCPNIGDIVCNNMLEKKVGTAPTDTTMVRNTFYDHTVAEFTAGKANQAKCLTSCSAAERESANLYVGVQVKMQEKKCMWAIYASNPSLLRCIPNFGRDSNGKNMSNDMLYLANETAATIAKLGDALGVGAFFQLGFAELKQTWLVLLISGIICAVMAAIWIVLLRWIIGPLVYCALVLILGVLIALGFVFKFLADDLEKNSLPGEKGTDDQVKWYRAFEYICFLLAAIYLLVMFYMLNRIRIAIAVMEEASRAFGATMSMIVVPVLTFVVMLGWIAFFIVTSIYIQTIGEVTSEKLLQSTSSYFGSEAANATLLLITSNMDSSVKPSASNPTQNITVWTTASNTKILHAYNILAILWTANFCLYFGFFIMVMCIVAYYFSATTNQMMEFEQSKDNANEAERKGKQKQTGPGVMCSALTSTICNHLGTILWGSMLIAIIQFVRALMVYLEETYLKDMDDTTAGAICLKCVHCCLWYIEHVVRVISQNAFIISAVRNTNFCSSAASAIAILVSNAARISVLTALSSMALFLIKCFIVGGNILIAYGLLKEKALTDNKPVQSGVFPIIVIILMSFAVATLFLNVYEACIDTVFMCFLIDEEHFKGEFMPPSLKKLVDLFEGAEEARLANEAAQKKAMKDVGAL